MVNRWPARPETLVRRFEKAALDRWAAEAVEAPLELRDVVETNYRLARANLLARVSPATNFQRRAQDG